jgi:hypothetical protein
MPQQHCSCPKQAIGSPATRIAYRTCVRTGRPSLPTASRWKTTVQYTFKTTDRFRMAPTTSQWDSHRHGDRVAKLRCVCDNEIRFSERINRIDLLHDAIISTAAISHFTSNCQRRSTLPYFALQVSLTKWTKNTPYASRTRLLPSVILHHDASTQENFAVVPAQRSRMVHITGFASTIGSRLTQTRSAGLRCAASKLQSKDSNTKLWNQLDMPVSLRCHFHDLRRSCTRLYGHLNCCLTPSTTTYCPNR